LPLPRALEVLDGVARGVAALHREGIVHRDLKPANVVLTAQGRPVVLDLGLAVAPDADERLTKTGALLGTPYYMAPEQLRGERPDPRVDVFALGLLAVEVTTGARAVEADTIPGVLAQVMAGELPVPSDRDASLPVALDQVVRRASALDREARFADASAFAEALAGVGGGGSRREARRRRALGLVAAVGAGALALGAAAYAVSRRGEDGDEASPLAAVQAQADDGRAGAEGAAPGAPAVASSPAPLTEAQVQAGDRALNAATRLGEPPARARALEAWLTDSPGHPREAEARAAMTEARRRFPQRVWRDANRGVFAGGGRILAFVRADSSRGVKANPEVRLLGREGQGLRSWTLPDPYVELLVVARDRTVAYAYGRRGVSRIDLEGSAPPVSWRLEGHVYSLALHPSEPLAAVGRQLDDQAHVELRRLPDGDLVRTLAKPLVLPPWNLTFSADGSRLLGGFGMSHFEGARIMDRGDTDNAVRIYDVASGEVVLEELIASRGYRAAAHPNGREAALSTNGGMIHRYDLLEGRKTGGFETKELATGRAKFLKLAMEGPIRGVAYAPDASLLLAGTGATGPDRGDLAGFDPETGQRVFFVAGVAMVRWLSVSDDGKWLLLSSNRELQLWRAR
jgi:hypothetical protein